MKMFPHSLRRNDFCGMLIKISDPNMVSLSKSPPQGRNLSGNRPDKCRFSTAIGTNDADFLSSPDAQGNFF